MTATDTICILNVPINHAPLSPGPRLESRRNC